MYLFKQRESKKFSNRGIDVAFKQEPYVLQNKLAGIPSTFKTYTSGNGRKRAAILIENKLIDAILIKQFSDEDYVVVEVNYEEMRWYALSIYFDINRDIEVDLQKVENILSYMGKAGCIICIDSNARSTFWYDRITNSKGKKLQEFLTASGLHVINEENDIPTFLSIRGESNIDLTVGNDSFVLYIKAWHCDEEESLLPERKNLKHFQEALNSACEKTFKLQTARKTVVKCKTVPWWNISLAVLRKKVNALRRRYQRTNNNRELREERKNQYLEKKKRYLAIIDQEKHKSWRECCNLTNVSNPWNVIYKVASGKMGRSSTLTTIKKPGGTYTNNLKETVECMVSHFVAKDNPNTDDNTHKEIRNKLKKDIQTEDDKEFTRNEIEDIIKNMDSKKAPGEDGIDSSIYLQLFYKFPHFTTTIYNECLKRGVFPEIWKRTIIVPIAKPGKEESDDPSKFRPITDVPNIQGKQEEEVYEFEVYTDGSKRQGKVGMAVVIYRNKQIINPLKHKLHNKCSNNQAKALAIYKALENLEVIRDIPEDKRTAVIYTDSRVTLESLRQIRNHAKLIEEIMGLSENL
ncbi:hypothetical protein ILUMI_12532 [Ignelater luminosus]|uniref:RNase H type-1 domain-containing protein n=1 Tax=Ignelater luminosus TaxID=2038154 RepID=A0A8K0CYE2_IGNLU|nr:hypothetical protein ILUMI_12532 [Ignelater luminosus]